MRKIKGVFFTYLDIHILPTGELPDAGITKLHRGIRSRHILPGFSQLNGRFGEKLPGIYNFEKILPRLS